jgi:hypothetical protein
VDQTGSIHKAAYYSLMPFISAKLSLLSMECFKLNCSFRFSNVNSDQSIKTLAISVQRFESDISEDAC